MGQTQEEKDKKDKASSAGKIIWFILIVLTIVTLFLSTWYYSQMVADYGMDTISNIGGSISGEFNSWS